MSTHTRSPHTSSGRAHQRRTLDGRTHPRSNRRAAVDRALDSRGTAIAARLLHPPADGPPPPLDHWELVLATVHLVRERGGDAAHEALRAALARTGHPATGTARRPHETLTRFIVGAVDRLVTAGLTTSEVVWHPLCHEGAPLAWYERETLRSEAAHVRVVAPDRAGSADPQP